MKNLDFFFQPKTVGSQVGQYRARHPFPLFLKTKRRSLCWKKIFLWPCWRMTSGISRPAWLCPRPRLGFCGKKNLSILKDFLSREKLTQKWLMPKVEQYAKHQLKLTKTPNSHWFYLDLNDQKTSHFYWSIFWLWFIRRNWFANKNSVSGNGNNPIYPLARGTLCIMFTKDYSLPL